MVQERLPSFRGFVVLCSIALGIMLSPENFVILGQQSGVSWRAGVVLGGSPNLPLYLKASAYLWLLTYARQHLSTLRGPDQGLRSAEPASVAIVCALVLAGAAVLALVTDPEWPGLVIYLLLVVGTLTLIGSIPYKCGKQQTI